MKTFCQKCGNELVSGASICAKCGFENAIAGRRRRLWMMVSLFLLIVFVGAAGFFFRGKIASMYERVRSGHGIASITDADFGKKELFRGAYEKYLLDRSYYLNAQGVSITTVPAADDLYKQRETFMSEIENMGCYSENFDRCNDLKMKVLNIDSELGKMMNDKMILGEYCGMDDADSKKNCDEYTRARFSLNDTCENCDADIQTLFEAGSALGNANNASALVEFAGMLRKHQSGYSRLIQMKNDLTGKTWASGLAPNDWKGLSMGYRQNALEAAASLRIEIPKEMDALNVEVISINDYIGVLNGNLKLNLPLIEKVR